MDVDAQSVVKLKSKQEDIFEVEKEVACRSVTVKNMIDDTGCDAPVPLPMGDSNARICPTRSRAPHPPAHCLVRFPKPLCIGDTRRITQPSITHPRRS